MITHYKITGGYPLNIKNLPKEAQLAPGLNVLVGPNGSGKSTIIHTLANYSSTPEPGWSRLLTPIEAQGLMNEKEFPEAYGHQCKIDAEIGWDGEPSYLHTADGGTQNDKFKPGNIMLQLKKASTGQRRMHKLNEMLKDFAGKNQPPTWQKPSHVNKIWEACCEKQLAYIGTLTRTGRQTLLLDEPERSLTLDLQLELWTETLPFLAKHCQIVVATHSIAGLLTKEANFIETEKGFLENCRQLTHKLAQACPQS